MVIILSVAGKQAIMVAVESGSLCRRVVETLVTISYSVQELGEGVEDAGLAVEQGLVV